MRLVGTAALVALLAGCGGSSTVVAQGDGDGSGAGKPAIATSERPTGEWRTSSIKQAPSTSVPGAKPDAFNLRFFDDGRVIAQARCNSISGAYRIADGRFRMNEAAQTEMGCPGDNRHEEDQWLAAFLTSGPAWSFDGKVIGLDGADIDVQLKPREEVQPNVALEGTSWRVTHITDGPAPGAPADPNSSVSASMAPPETELQFGAGLSRLAADTPDAPAGSPPSAMMKGRSGCADFFARVEKGERDSAGAGQETLRFGSMTVDDSRCEDGRPAGLDQILAVLQGDVIAKINIDVLTLQHSSGKGLQLRADGNDAVDKPGSPTPGVGSGSAKPDGAGQAFAGGWRATSISEKPSSDAPGAKPATFMLRFHRLNGIGVQARCNSIGGEYRIEDDRLVVEQVGQTLMGCPGAREQEDRWLVDFFEAKPRFRFDGGSLHLSTDHITVVFEPAK